MAAANRVIKRRPGRTIGEAPFREFFRSPLPDALLLHEQFHNVPAPSRRADHAFLQQSTNHCPLGDPIFPWPSRRIVSSSFDLVSVHWLTSFKLAVFTNTIHSSRFPELEQGQDVIPVKGSPETMKLP